MSYRAGATNPSFFTPCRSAYCSISSMLAAQNGDAALVPPDTPASDAPVFSFGVTVK